MGQRKLWWTAFGILVFLLAGLNSGVCQQISLVSINSSRTGSGNLPSINQKISANGRYVVFESDADNLVSLDNNGMRDVFRYDLLTGSMRLVSATANGASGNGGSYNPVITAGGQFVVFTSEASDLLCTQPGCPGDTNNLPDVYRVFLPPGPDVVCQPSCTQLVSINEAGTDSTGGFIPAVSADGREVAFFNLQRDIFLRQYGDTGATTRRITIPVRGPFPCPRFSSNMTISENGIYIAFESLANDLTMEDDPCSGSESDKDVFVYDRIANLVRLASRSNSNTAGNGVSERPVVANDGTVAFESAASDLVNNDNNNQPDIFLFRPNNVSLISVNAGGTGSGNGISQHPSISRDGRRIAFDSTATDLAATVDLNNTVDVFLRDLNSNTTSLVSLNRNGNAAGSNQSNVPFISADGRFVAFSGSAGDLVNGFPAIAGFNVFARDLAAGRTKLISFNINNNNGFGGNFPSFTPQISANGRVIAFQSNATNLVALPDANQEEIDIFALSQSRQTTDFDDDGQTDFALWRPSSGVWYIRSSSDGTSAAIRFGLTGDIPQPADYDGDGRTDIAVYRPDSGTWFVLRSSDSNFTVVRFGIAEDKPVAADYNGDGRAELAVFRPSTGVWWTFNTLTQSAATRQWGLTGDKPVPQDYDGDNRADLCVFRPSNGTWYIWNSTNNSFRFAQWGLSDDKPVAGDYDGDNRADLAVWRPSTGVWYALRSTNNSMLALPWGTTGDVPQPGDFDGDGRNDFVVWRPSDHNWYILQSSTGAFSFLNFGADGDIPVASAYRIE